MENRGRWFQTNAGRKFYVMDPRPEDFDICDIAHALAWKFRWSCYLDKQFSVAAHSLVVARLVEPKYALRALLHDKTEAYWPDVPTPVKQEYPILREREDLIEAAADKYFGFAPMSADEKYSIKRMDIISRHKEYKLFFNNKLDWEDKPPNYDVSGWDDYPDDLWVRAQRLAPDETKNAFIRAFKDLAKKGWGVEGMMRFFQQ
jgi:5'-deoxynucleotidase YfbR-like HD superfamily hydrolase